MECVNHADWGIRGRITYWYSVMVVQVRVCYYTVNILVTRILFSRDDVIKIHEVIWRHQWSINQWKLHCPKSCPWDCCAMYHIVSHRTAMYRGSTGQARRSTIILGCEGPRQTTTCALFGSKGLIPQIPFRWMSTRAEFSFPFTEMPAPRLCGREINPFLIS